MTTHVQFLRIKKLTGKAIIHKAAKHNLREIAAEVGVGSHIDPARIADNVILFGSNSADGVAGRAQALMDEANVRPLKINAVRALEVIFSLPTETTANQRQFFEDATRWVGEHFGVPMLSSTIHNDEGAPHCHVILLPLVNGRMVGSDLVGGRSKLQGLQAAFHDGVGRPHGLVRQMPQKRHSAAVCEAAMALAFDVLDANSGLNSVVLRLLLVPHAKNPEPLLKELGLSMPAPKASGSFVATMTRPTKPDTPIGKRPRNPIGIGDVDTPKNELSLSCVGIGLAKPAFSPANEVQQGSRNTTGNSIDAVTYLKQRPASELPAPTSSGQPEPTACAHSKSDECEQVPPATRIAPLLTCTAEERRQSVSPGLLFKQKPPCRDTDDEYTRERDSDTPANYWDVDRGEFAKVSRRELADKAVQVALQSRISCLTDARRRRQQFW